MDLPHVLFYLSARVNSFFRKNASMSMNASPSSCLANYCGWAAGLRFTRLGGLLRTAVAIRPSGCHERLRRQRGLISPLQGVKGRVQGRQLTAPTRGRNDGHGHLLDARPGSPGQVAKACVEINQWLGCTRQFFTKSVLGRAVRNRHRHAIEQESRRWRGGRRDDQRERAVKF